MLEKEPDQDQIEIMKAIGWDEAGITALKRLKDRVERGEATDLTEDYKRMLFLKYLVKKGKLKS